MCFCAHSPSKFKAQSAKEAQNSKLQAHKTPMAARLVATIGPWTIETPPVSTEGRTFAKAGQDSRTPRRYRDLHAPSNVRPVLECAAPAALFFGRALDDRDTRGLD